MKNKFDGYYTYAKNCKIWLTQNSDIYNYTDGESFEKTLLQNLRQSSDVSFHSKVLAKYEKDWASIYHLTPIRANLFRPFEKILKNSKVLELGCGCGALTRFLAETSINVVAVEGSKIRAEITAERCRDLDNVDIIVDNIFKLPIKELGRFDVVTLIGVLEYAALYQKNKNAFLNLLKLAKHFLTSEGVLILAIENQMGLKYLAGEPEDHLQIPWIGVTNTYSEFSPKTFTKKEIIELLKKAGFTTTEQFIPIPDYKLPHTIVTPVGIQAYKQGDLNISSLFFNNHKTAYKTTFNKNLCWKVVEKAGLIEDLVDSFCFISYTKNNISKKLYNYNVLAYHYSNIVYNISDFCRITSFLRNDNRIEVKKEKLFKNKNKEQTKYFIREFTESYNKNELLLTNITKIVCTPSWTFKNIVDCLRPWYEKLRELVDTEGMINSIYIDAGPYNTLINEDDCIFFDLEWGSDTKVKFLPFFLRHIYVMLDKIDPMYPPKNYTTIDYQTMIIEISIGLEPTLTENKISDAWNEKSTLWDYLNIINVSYDQLKSIYFYECIHPINNQDVKQPSQIEIKKDEIFLLKDCSSYNVKFFNIVKYFISKYTTKLIYDYNRLLRYKKRYGVRKTVKKIISKIVKKITLDKFYNHLLSILGYYSEWNVHKLIEKNKKVSIIVPNYNHANFLRQRLDSIYNQTYQDFEVIILDDRSTDNSRDIIEEYRSNFPDKTKVLLNDINVGNPFKQWFMGIDAAKYDYIWIAESDDYCDNKFIETVIKPFDDEAVQLSYCATDFIENGKKIYDIQTYLKNFNVDFNHSFLMSAHKFIRNVMFCKNAIPNVSGAIFKKPVSINLNLKNKICSLQLCGDWLLYLYILKGGVVAYCHETLNFYRIHKDSTSLRIQKTLDYYDEQLQVLNYIKDNFILNEKHIKSKLDDLKIEFKEKANYDFNALLGLISKYNLKEFTKIINIAICGYSFILGGGEIFPIHLANALRRKGISVTYFNFEEVEQITSVKNILASDIPIINVPQKRGISNIVKKLGVNILHSHHGSIDNIISNLVKHDEARHFVTIHGFYDAINDDDHALKILTKLKNNKTNFIYIAEKNLRLPGLANISNTSLKYIPNSLSKDLCYSVKRSDIGIPDEDFVLCLVSRAIPEKGWREAIEIVNKVNEVGKQSVHLVLIGDGEEYKICKTMESSRIHVLGKQNKIQDFFNISDFGFLPSKFLGESYPLVNIECLLTGTPVIASDVGDIKKQLTADNGMIAGAVFELENGTIPIDKVVALILSFVSDKEKIEQVRNLAKELSNKFNIDNMVNEYIKYYLSKL